MPGGSRAFAELDADDARSQQAPGARTRLGTAGTRRDAAGRGVFRHLGPRDQMRPSCCLMWRAVDKNKLSESELRNSMRALANANFWMDIQLWRARCLPSMLSGMFQGQDNALALRPRYVIPGLLSPPTTAAERLSQTKSKRKMIVCADIARDLDEPGVSNSEAHPPLHAS